MANPYTSVSISGYNANPPSDDGTQASQNEVEWAKHKDKLGDPLKTAIESIDTNVTTAFAATVTPPGTIVAYAGLVAPSGWLLCDGTTGLNSVTDTTLADLYGVITTEYGGTGAADFDLPDLRGVFIRGFNDGKTGSDPGDYDPDAGSRTDRGDGTAGDNIGTKQSFAMEAHTHSAPAGGDYLVNAAGSASGGGASDGGTRPDGGDGVPVAGAAALPCPVGESATSMAAVSLLAEAEPMSRNADSACMRSL